MKIRYKPVEHMGEVKSKPKKNKKIEPEESNTRTIKIHNKRRSKKKKKKGNVLLIKICKHI